MIMLIVIYITVVNLSFSNYVIHTLFYYMWSQVTVPLSHLINVLHSMKSSVGSSSSSTTCKSRKHKQHASDSEQHRTEVYFSRTSSVIAVSSQRQCDATCSCFHPPKLFNINLFQNYFVRNINQMVCVCSPCGTCVSLAYQTWEHGSWMSWWTACCHAWVHRRRRVHWPDRQPGGPRIFLHTPFTTISMVSMLLNRPLMLYLTILLLLPDSSSSLMN